MRLIVCAAFVQKESGSSFDATSYKGVEAPGAHPPPSSDAPDDEAFSVHRRTDRVDTRRTYFLCSFHERYAVVVVMDGADACRYDRRLGLPRFVRRWTCVRSAGGDGVAGTCTPCISSLLALLADCGALARRQLVAVGRCGDACTSPLCDRLPHCRSVECAFAGVCMPAFGGALSAREGPTAVPCSNVPCAVQY